MILCVDKLARNGTFARTGRTAVDIVCVSPTVPVSYPHHNGHPPASHMRELSTLALYGFQVNALHNEKFRIVQFIGLVYYRPISLLFIQN